MNNSGRIHIPSVKTHLSFFRASNEKVRSIQYELLTARTEVEQANEKVMIRISRQPKEYFHILVQFNQQRTSDQSINDRISSYGNQRLARTTCQFTANSK